MTYPLSPNEDTLDQVVGKYPYHLVLSLEEKEIVKSIFEEECVFVDTTSFGFRVKESLFG